MGNISLILLLSILSTATVHAQDRKLQCAQNGEYCLTHNDCCSRSCLSFSYKCVPVPPNASIGTTLVPVQSSTIDTANRFGGPGDDGGASLTQKTCALNGEYCLTHAECCSGNCLAFSYKCVTVSQVESTVMNSREPYNQTTLAFSHRVGEETTSTIAMTRSTTKTTPKQCAGIGEYCLTPNDCCSGSCLSFSYKCVTNHQLKRPSPLSTTALGSTFVNRVGSSSDTNTAKCAAIGEYCLTSSECCSKSCLSFAYKCVNRYDLATNTDRHSVTTTSSIENRFGISSSSSSVGTANPQCISNGLYCVRNMECCSGACFKSICSTEIRLGVAESELTRPSVANGPYVPVKNLDDLIDRFGGNTSTKQTPDGRAVLTRTCKINGDSCTQHEDCCSSNCHSYRGKCVN